MAIGHVEGWTSADGVVCIVSETELPSIFPICRIIAECDVSWTLKSHGGDLVGHKGEKFAIVFGVLRLCRSFKTMIWND